MSISDESVSATSQRLAKLDAIFRGFYPDVSPEKIANDLFISVRQLDRICHQYYNMSFMQKYRESRMILASGLLKKFNDSNELTLNEIAQKLGYSSLKYFPRCLSNITEYHQKNTEAGIKNHKTDNNFKFSASAVLFGKGGISIQTLSEVHIFIKQKKTVSAAVSAFFYTKNRGLFILDFCKPFFTSL